MTDPETIRAAQRAFGSEDGHRVLQYMLGRFAYTQSSTLDGDPHKMAFNEGQRFVMVELGKLLAMDAETLEAEQEDDDETRAHF